MIWIILFVSFNGLVNNLVSEVPNILVYSAKDILWWVIYTIYLFGEEISCQLVNFFFFYSFVRLVLYSVFVNCGLEGTKDYCCFCAS